MLNIFVKLSIRNKNIKLFLQNRIQIRPSRSVSAIFGALVSKFQGILTEGGLSGIN